MCAVPKGMQVHNEVDVDVEEEESKNDFMESLQKLCDSVENKHCK